MVVTPTERARQGLLTTVQRRKVVQWGVAYAAGAWALLEVFGFAADTFGWPAMSKQLAMLAFAFGFPIAVVLAWYHGDRGEQRVPPTEVALLVAVLLVASASAWWWRQRAEPQLVAVAGHPEPAVNAPAHAATNSIAILPFLNLSSDPEQEYFSDGVSEQILDLLARIPELRVIARTSSFAFKGKEADVATIAERLNVSHVLEGSVRKSGDRVRITTQLIRTSDSSQLWSETYDRHLTDIFAIQDEIALAVVQKLKLTLLAQQLPRRSTTNNPEAFALLLQANYLISQYGRESLQQAHALLERALVLDPGYADGWAALGRVQYLRMQFGLVPWDEGIDDAAAAAGRALALDPENVGGLLLMSSVLISQNWDWSTAGKLIDKAVKLQPGGTVDALAGHAYRLGRPDEAVVHFRRALDADPLNAMRYRGLAMALLASGEPAEAEAAMRVALQLNPHLLSGNYWMGRALLAGGRVHAAIEAMQKEELEGYRLTGLAVVWYAAGRLAESDAALRRLESEYSDGMAYQIAEVLAFRGDLDGAFRWLDRAYALHDAGLLFVKVDVRQAAIHKDPRYLALLKKMNFPDT